MPIMTPPKGGLLVEIGTPPLRLPPPRKGRRVSVKINGRAAGIEARYNAAPAGHPPRGRPAQLHPRAQGGLNMAHNVNPHTRRRDRPGGRPRRHARGGRLGRRDKLAHRRRRRARWRSTAPPSPSASWTPSAPTARPQGPHHHARRLRLQERQRRAQKEFDLYANVRPPALYKGVPGRLITSTSWSCARTPRDLYAGIEHLIGDAAAESIKLITRAGSERIARYAFDYAVNNAGGKVTCVHKANIMKCTDGLFLDTCRAVAADYPQIESRTGLSTPAACSSCSAPRTSTCSCCRTSTAT